MWESGVDWKLSKREGLIFFLAFTHFISTNSENANRNRNHDKRPLFQQLAIAPDVGHETDEADLLPLVLVFPLFEFN